MSWNYPLELYALDELTELVNFTRTLEFANIELYPGETWTVNIVANQTNPTVNITGNTISGFYSGALGGFSIQFLDKNYNYDTVAAWNQVTNAAEIIKYMPSLMQSNTYYYEATATSDPSNISVNATFSIVVTNNWDVGKSALQAAVAQTIAERE